MNAQRAQRANPPTREPVFIEFPRGFPAVFSRFRLKTNRPVFLLIFALKRKNPLKKYAQKSINTDSKRIILILL